MFDFLDQNAPGVYKKTYVETVLTAKLALSKEIFANWVDFFL